MQSSPLFASKSLLFTLLVALILSTTQCNLTRNSGATPTPPAPSSSSKQDRLRSEIPKYAAQFKDVPYKSGGKDPNGFDCSGFTSYVMKHFDISLSPSSKEQAKQGRPRPVYYAKPGDLVVFRHTPGGEVFHVALVVDASPTMLRVIHATTSKGVIIEDLYLSSYWKEKVWEVRDILSK